MKNVFWNTCVNNNNKKIHNRIGLFNNMFSQASQITNNTNSLIYLTLIFVTIFNVTIANLGILLN